MTSKILSYILRCYYESFCNKNEYYNNIVGYLIYYPKNKTFYIELIDAINLQGMPIILEHFYNLGKKQQILIGAENGLVKELFL